MSDALDAVTAGILSQYESTRKGTLPAGVSISGISAMLESDNTFRLYYNFSDGEPSGLTFKIDGNDARIIRRSDGRYYLALPAGVYSNHLQDVHTYSVSDGKDTYTITASVLTYARSCAIKKGTGKAIDNERSIGKALYLYNRAAVAAFGK